MAAEWEKSWTSRDLMPRRGWLVFFVLLAICLVHRTVGIGQKPEPFLSTYDEYHYVWVGQTLWETGVAESWSFLAAYKESAGHVVGYGPFRGGVVRLVRPALDHPPLFSLVAGGYAKLVGAFLEPLSLGAPPAEQAHGWKPPDVPPQARDFRAGRTRTLTLLLFMATFFLTFDLGRRVIGAGPALAGLALYGLMPYSVIHGRLLVTENLTTPLFLTGLVTIDRYLAGRWSRRRFAAVVIAATAAAVLCKLVALAAAAAFCVVLLMLAQGSRRRVFADALLVPGLGAAAGVALVLLYGWQQDWEVLTSVLHLHAGRFRGFDLWPQLALAPQLVNEPGADRTLLLAWGVAAALCAREWTGRGEPSAPGDAGATLRGLTPAAFFAVPFVHAAAHAYFVSTREFCGWHVLPYYPFLYLALGLALWALVRHANYGAWIATVALMAPRAGQTIHDLVKPPPLDKREWWDGGALRPTYLGFVVLALVLPALGPRARKWTVRIGTAALVATELIAGIRLVHL